MQSVSADQQVEIARRALVEGESDTVTVLLDGGDAVAEDRLNFVFDGGVDRGGQVTAWQAGEIFAEHAAKNVDVHVGFDFAVGADGAQVFNLVAGGGDLILEPMRLATW